MRRWVRSRFPLMYHRRLILLGVMAGFIMFLLVGQTVLLTVVWGAQLRRETEDALIERRLTPTIRGQIFDRHGRILARDRTRYDLAVDYAILMDQWAYHCARREAVGLHRLGWRELDDRERQDLIERYKLRYDEQVEELWRTLAEISQTNPAELERRRDGIVRSIHRMTRAHWRKELDKRGDQLDALAFRQIMRKRIAEQNQSHVLIEDLADPARFAINRKIEQALRGEPGAVGESNRGPGPNVWKYVFVQSSTKRDYPSDRAGFFFDRLSLPGPLARPDPLEVEVVGLSRHLVGRMRQRISQEQLRLYPYKQKQSGSDRINYNLHGYMPDDPIGAGGIEGSLELHLRGTRGRVTTYRDGREPIFVAPVPGGDGVLTIDIRLQARIAAILSNNDPADPTRPGLGLMRSQPWHHKATDKPFVVSDNEALLGAAVVLDVDSGHVLASVSVPWQRPDDIRPNNASRWNLINKPWLNRAIAMPYPPGSTAKPLVLAAVYSDHKLGHDETITCTGHLYPGKLGIFRCWYFTQTGGTHGAILGPDAIMRSCNVFFYNCGLYLGAENIRSWYWRFGLGRKTGCGVAEERATHGAGGHGERAAALMAIGQGPVEWTVLQAAAAYAALARYGLYIPPTFIIHPTPPVSRSATVDLRLDPRGVELVLEGLRRSANHADGTTARLRFLDGSREPTFNIDGVEILAKSGTAEAPDLTIARDHSVGQAREIVRQGDHGWTIAIIKRPDRPRSQFVIAVVVEYGGSGGHVAGPIVNQILYAMRAEGYL